MQASAFASEPGDRIEFVTVPELPGVEQLRVDAVSRLWRWHHETYTVSSPPAPVHVEWRYRSCLHRTEPVTVALMEPGEVHVDVSKANRRERLRVLFLSPDLVDAAAREIGLGTGTVHWRDGQVVRPDIHGQLLRTHAALEGGTTVLERQTRVAHVVERLLSEHSDSGPRVQPARAEPGAVARARAVLLERWRDNVSLDELVAAAGIGRFRLMRAFRATLGLPPHAYQIRVRVARAMAMIRTGVPLVDVAGATGFTDQSHLARHFTRVVGVTPGRYRQAVR
jgi:AraC-like DNA-binding protein